MMKKIGCVLLAIVGLPIVGYALVELFDFFEVNTVFFEEIFQIGS